MLAFFKKHIVGGIGIFVGSAISIGSLVLHVYALHEMGLPIEIWVAVGLGIFILSVVGILYKWWDENQRIPAGQGQGTRSQIAEPERIQAALSHVKSLRPSSEQSLVPQDVYYFHDTTPGRGYPHKVWIVLRNAGRRDLFVSPAKWETSTGDIATRPISQHPWTPEGPGGWEKNSWSWPREERQNEPIHVPRGGIIQTWVGLPGPLHEVELRRRIVTKRLGALIIPVKVNGETRSETIRL
jgi:hypothetical protein